MGKISTVKELVNCWPTRAALAEDINSAAGSRLVTAGQIHKWAEKQSIPAKFHYSVVRSASRRGYPVTAELIVTLHSPVRVSE